MIEQILEGVAMALTWQAVGMVAIGVFAGITVGAIPGLSGVMATAILVPFSFFMSPVLGIPFLLDREPGTILTDAAKCLGTCGACFAIAFAGQSVMSPESYSALPSWLPIIVFSPLAVVLIDRIRT